VNMTDDEELGQALEKTNEIENEYFFVCALKQE
jgi:hypothetical protein